MSDQARFCGSCGSALTAGVRFCTSCGQPVGQPVAPPTAPPLQAPVQAPYPPQPYPPQPYPPQQPYAAQPGTTREWLAAGPPRGPERRSRPWIWVAAGLAVLLVAGGGVVAWALLGRDSDVVGTITFGPAVLAEPVVKEPDREWRWSPPGDDYVSNIRVVGDVVLVASESEVTALDEDGEELWTSGVDGPGYVVGAPVGEPDLVLVSGEDGGLVALSIEDGDEVWSSDDPVVGSDEKGVYVTSGDGDLSLLDAGTGDVTWSVAASDGYGLGRGGAFVVHDDELRRLDDDGGSDWSAPIDVVRDGDYVSIAVADDFVVASGAEGATAYDAGDGERLWSVPAGPDGTDVGLFARDRVYVYGTDYESDESDGVSVEVSVRDRRGEVGTIDADSYFYAYFFVSGGESYAFAYDSGRLYDEDLDSVGRYAGDVTPVEGGLYRLDGGELSYYELGAGSPSWTLREDVGEDATIRAGDHRVVVLDAGEVSSYG